MKKLYGLPTLVVLLAALVAFVYYRMITFAGPKFLSLQVPLDLKIYALAGEDIAAGNPLYVKNYIWDLPFTYPPFSGVVFQWLGGFSDLSLTLWWQCATALAMLAVIVLVFRERGLRLTPLTWAVIVALVVLTPANEAIQGTLFYGQINVILMFLVALDVLPRKFRLPGIGIGLAAGLKLTPAYMGLLLLWERRWWSVLGCVAAFAATVGIGFVFISDAKVFWTDAIFKSSRVGDHANPGAKALKSLLIRIWGIDGGWVWLLGVLVIFAFTLLALRTARLRDNRSAAMAMVGLSGCLVSPFTWYHHYVWTIPLSVVFFVVVNQALGCRWRSVWGAQAAAVVSVLALCAINFPFLAGPVWFGLSSGSLDAQTNLQPFATLLWPGTCVVVIVGYGLWGLFLRPTPGARTYGARHAA